ncbi:MAG: hypothetical protein ACJAY8_000161 [Sphingobacteriales bacterium]|jgi:hypothetical protein
MKIKGLYLFLLIAFLFNGRIIKAQEGILSGVVVSRNTLTALPFTSLGFMDSGKGGICNELGEFRIRGNYKDEVCFSHIGFKTLCFPFKSGTDTIYLIREIHKLDSVLIYPENDPYLFALLKEVRRREGNQKHQGKTHFQLHSELSGDTVEMVEAFYNLSVRGYSPQKLDLKAGRIGLKAKENQFFLSTATSNAFSLYQLSSSSPFFPDNPFSKGSRFLNKNYNLNLIHKIPNPESGHLWLIGFEPKATQGHFFSGEVWVDDFQFQIHEILLNSNPGTRHPFLPFGERYNQLDSVHFSIHNKYNTGKLEHSDFNYTLYFPQGRVETFAQFNVFDSTLFTLPSLEFPNFNHSDYRKIRALPENDTLFGAKTQPFSVGNFPNQITQFQQKHTNLSRSFEWSPRNKENHFFESPYIHWQAENRIFMREKDSQKQVDFHHKKPPTEAYNLKAHLYLDCTSIRANVIYTTAAIFDPFLSHYSLPHDSTTNAFVNMYFDLVEIHRRTLNNWIARTPNQDMQSVQQKHHEITEKLEATEKAFFKDVQHGTNKHGMYIWNSYIEKELEINNLDLFELIPQKIEGIKKVRIKR